MLRLFRQKMFSGRKHFSWKTFSGKTISFLAFGSDNGDKSNNNGGGGGCGGGGDGRGGGKFSDDKNGGGVDRYGDEVFVALPLTFGKRFTGLKSVKYFLPKWTKPNKIKFQNNKHAAHS